MGAYDTLILGEEHIQLKCFGAAFRIYHVGDRLPPLRVPNSHIYSYHLITREGWLLTIRDRHIIKTERIPPHWHQFSIRSKYGYPIFDKWGNRLGDGSARGSDIDENNENYFFIPISEEWDVLLE